MAFTEIEQFQHDSFQRTVLVQPAGFYAVFRFETDIHRFLHLPVAPARSLADVLIRGKGRDAERRTNVGSRSLFILHDPDMLQETELAKQHGEHIHPVGTGEQLIAHQEKSPAALPGNNGIHHLEDRAFRGRRGDGPDGIRVDGRSVSGM